MNCQVLLFHLPISATETLLELAMLLQVSSVATVWTAHVPSVCGFGARSGKDPVEQHTCCPGSSLEQTEGSLLYLEKSAPEIPHCFASEAHESPDLTCTVVQSLRRKSLEADIGSGFGRSNSRADLSVTKEGSQVLPADPTLNDTRRKKKVARNGSRARVGNIVWQ